MEEEEPIATQLETRKYGKEFLNIEEADTKSSKKISVQKHCDVKGFKQLKVLNQESFYQDTHIPHMKSSLHHLLLKQVLDHV